MLIADEFAVGKHRQMPHPMIRHQAHGVLQRIAGGNRDHGMGAMSRSVMEIACSACTLLARCRAQFATARNHMCH
jgi:hypothetical protein